MKKTTIITLTTSMLLAVGAAEAAGDEDAGKARSALCAACHGADGSGTDFGPAVTGSEMSTNEILDIIAKTHLSIGQEATAVGVCFALRGSDYMATTHRGHGHCLAKGAEVDLMFAELLGKPESYVMIAIKPGTPLTFAGSDEPAAFVRLKSIGLPKERCTEFSEKICGFVEQELEVPPTRVFIDFKDLEREMFGWNGKTF